MKFHVYLGKFGQMYIEDVENSLLWDYDESDQYGWQDASGDMPLYRLIVFYTDFESDLEKYKVHLATCNYDQKCQRQRKLENLTEIKVLQQVAEKARTALDACWLVQANDGLTELDELHQVLVPVTKWVAK